MKPILGVHLILILTVALSSCVDVAMSGAQVVYNRHSLQKNFSDQYITMQAFQALEIDDIRFKNSHVVLAAFNGELLMTGQVPEAWQKDLAGEIVNKIPNIKKIYNLINIASPSSTLTRFSDTWITAKVKAKLLASNDIETNQIKVLTENSTVYLMGILQPKEANAAVELARNTDGVASVVKIFSYVQITKEEKAQG